MVVGQRARPLSRAKRWAAVLHSCPASRTRGLSPLPPQWRPLPWAERARARPKALSTRSRTKRDPFATALSQCRISPADRRPPGCAPQFENLVIHISGGDSFYAKQQGSGLSWWNHGHSHATAELYQGKDRCWPCCRRGVGDVAAISARTVYAHSLLGSSRAVPVEDLLMI
jgi:hypothetical protein